MEYVRKIEKIVKISEGLFVIYKSCKEPAVAPTKQQIWLYLLPSSPPNMAPLDTAVHEVRHRLQIEKRVPLITKKELQSFPNFLKMFEEVEDKGVKEDEIDAAICAAIGSLLLEINEVEEFRQLMLYSRLPENAKDYVKKFKVEALLPSLH